MPDVSKLAALPLPDSILREGVRALPTNGHLSGRIFEIPKWKDWSMERRLAFLQKFIEDKGRDPQLREFTIQVLNDARAPTTDARAQWAAILRWVQQNVRYSLEPGEQLQSPQYTLQTAATKTGAADCDDMAILIAAMGQSIALPSKLVITGRTREGQRAQYIHHPTPTTLQVSLYGKGLRHMPAGGLVPGGGTRWTHIYLLCGLQPLNAQTWTFCEPTLPVPLGWDVVWGGAMPQGAGQSGGGAGRSDLAGLDARPAPYLFSGPDGTPAPEAPPGVVSRTLAALRAAITPEAVIAVAVPTVIGIYAAKLATRGR